MILQIGLDEVTKQLHEETAIWEKKKETVQRWGEPIEMQGSLAPLAGQRVTPS
ncbi:hypothetical protein NEHOM01_0661 [Nematocida homosporus]|uniref:uncharacterized protein n=1 Tax=Nematocida homosporus TaxID=1912981 RepID=UPI00221F6E36|nr:uncharacterized protein NEHOM01_0661 [Nematocida homosporus]KAI5185203.1 hypothetical protein NEHOM01_0661 [Nematocida homosporus]